MANEKLKQNYKDIANAIRSKTGENGLIKAEEMPDKIDSIHVGIEPEGTKEIRANGEYNIREFENVNVDVPGATTKELFEATANGTYDIAEYANVKVDVPNPSSGTLDITKNGNYDVTEKAGVNVNVPNPSTGTYKITENGTYDITDYAEVDVDVASTPTYGSYYMYITDGSGNLLTDEGEYAGSNDVFWRDGSNLEYEYLNTEELYKFDGTSGNSAFTHIQLDSSSNLYYYTGDSCSPLSGVDVESNHLYRYAGYGNFNDIGEVTSDWNVVLCHTGGSDTVSMMGFKDLEIGESTEVIMYTSYGDEYRLLITRQSNS